MKERINSYVEPLQATNIDSQSNERMGIKWEGNEISMPSPSKPAIDSWWRTAGHTFVGAVIALAGVGAGVLVALKVIEKK